MLKRIVLLILAAMAVLLPAGTDAMTGPFSWGTDTTIPQWCPSYQQQTGCNTSQHPSQYTVSFSTGRVGEDSSGNIDLVMDTGAEASGAFNTEGYETWGLTAGRTVYETISLPCDSSGNVENWPAFWMDGTVGSWPEYGEIDIVEGLNSGGKTGVWWHYHYLNASGKAAQVGGEYPTSGCGTHRYGVDRLHSGIYFYMDGTKYGTVTASQIGVPLATDAMYVINDYGAGSYGGPTANGAVMVASKFWGAATCQQVGC